jgi:flagella basal body P-ring formation protein FlgA
MEALRGHGIIVFDTRNLTEVLITRESRTLSLNDLSRAVADAAGKRFEFSNVADLTVAFDSHMKPLQIEPSVTDAPKIGNITYDPRTNRFDATIDMPGSMKLRRSPVRLTGTLVETTEVVTLARPISRSEIIRESDLVIERLARAEIPTDAITKLELVVNQAARRALRTGQTLRVADLMKPQIVTRDEGVTIVFRSGGITLTMRGKAMNNGAEGDSIPVLNPQSKRVVQATVTGPGVVTVGDINPLTTAAINNNR